MAEKKKASSENDGLVAITLTEYGFTVFGGIYRGDIEVEKGKPTYVIKSVSERLKTDFPGCFVYFKER